MSLSKKVITCFVAALCIIALLFNIFNTGADVDWYPAILSFYIAAILLPLSIISAFIWHNRQGKNKINSQKYFDVLYNIIRYSLAFNISFFGWAKLLELQFRIPDSISNQPMNQQSGEWLTWYYFSYSYGFNLILAAIQIAGSVLLLFRKTLMFGAVMLFAIMSNITLINIFYKMNFGALLLSIIVVTGIAYLLLLDYKRLAAFFFTSNANVHSTQLSNYVMRMLFKGSAIILSLLFVIYLKSIIVGRG